MARRTVASTTWYILGCAVIRWKDLSISSSKDASMCGASRRYPPAASRISRSAAGVSRTVRVMPCEERPFRELCSRASLDPLDLPLPALSSAHGSSPFATRGQEYLSPSSCPRSRRRDQSVLPAEVRAPAAGLVPWSTSSQRYASAPPSQHDPAIPRARLRTRIVHLGRGHGGAAGPSGQRTDHWRTPSPA